MYGRLTTEVSEFVCSKKLSANALRLFIWCVPRFKDGKRFKAEPESQWVESWVSSQRVSASAPQFVQFGKTQPASDLFNGSTSMVKTYRKELVKNGILEPIPCEPNKHHAPIYAVCPSLLRGSNGTTPDGSGLRGSNGTTPDTDSLKGSKNASWGYRNAISGVVGGLMTCEDVTLPEFQKNNPTACVVSVFERTETPPVKKCPRCGSEKTTYRNSTRMHECLECNAAFR